jgi:flagellar hook-length control protein FliK
VKDVIANDLKSVLLQAGSEVTKSSHPNQSEILRHIDKLTLTIDYHQLVSHLSNSTSLSLPFSYEQLQEGHIEFKRDKENRFYCDINLKLKEYGELNLKLTLYDKNQLNIHIYSNNAEFKEMIKENIPSLRSALIENQITPREIRLFEPKTESKKFSPYETQAHPIDVGFEVKV